MPIRKATSSLTDNSSNNSDPIDSKPKAKPYPFGMDSEDEMVSPYGRQRREVDGDDIPRRVNLKDKSKVKDRSSSKKYVLVLSIVLVALLGVAGYFYFTSVRGNSLVSPIFTGIADSISNGLSNENVYVNPLNGVKIPNEQAAEFKDRKPIAVMVNNYEVARPSAGLSKADIIYEAVAEAGITRLMPIFYSQIPEKASSIRSARYYFAQLAAPYNPHYIHWGAAHVPPCQKLASTAAGYCGPIGGKVETEPAVDAYDQIVKLGLPNLDGGNYSCDAASCAFGRDPQKLGKIPLEHTAFVRLPLVYQLAKDIRPQDSWHKFITPDHPWIFKDEASAGDRGDIGASTPITYKYWDTQPAFDVKWEYDKDKNEYIRYQGGVKQTDAIDGAELRAKVVIIRFTVQRPVNDKKAHLYHDITGTNKALIFQDGKVIEGIWSRNEVESMDVYRDLTSKEIEFNRGQIWVQLVPTENKVSYGVATTPASTTQTPNTSN
jgi:hypothetical protein